MEELQINVIETRPAIVNFNYQEISDYLDKTLANYQGLVFTDKTVSDCKKTIAELRKGQKSLDDFRKETKKKLTESVTSFENQCKQLYGKFDMVITPLTTQYDQFEIDRREAKRKTIQDIIGKVIPEHALVTKYASQLVIPEEYLTKSKSITAIEGELNALARSLKVEQDKEAQDIDLVKTKVELANSKYLLSVGLTDGTYVSMLVYRTVEEISNHITTDAEAIQKREQTYKESLKAASAPTPQTIITVAEPEPEPEPIQASPEDIAILSDHFKETIEVEGSNAQFRALEAFLNSNNFKWDYK